jgi:hypothetical protein
MTNPIRHATPQIPTADELEDMEGRTSLEVLAYQGLRQAAGLDHRTAIAFLVDSVRAYDLDHPKPTPEPKSAADPAHPGISPEALRYGAEALWEHITDRDVTIDYASEIAMNIIDGAELNLEDEDEIDNERAWVEEALFQEIGHFLVDPKTWHPDNTDETPA